MDERIIEGKMIRLVEGNIALLDVDAIVNAANTSLVLGGGVAGAIRRWGGPSIQEECDRLAPIQVGQAVMTGGGRLKARFVIHAVGPVYGEGDEEAKLARATYSSLILAKDKKLASIAFPAISAGIFGFPLPRCSEIMLSEAVGFMRGHEFPGEIVFCLFGEEALSVFRQTFHSMVL